MYATNPARKEVSRQPKTRTPKGWITTDEESMVEEERKDDLGMLRQPFRPKIGNEIIIIIIIKIKNKRDEKDILPTQPNSQDSWRT